MAGKRRVPMTQRELDNLKKHQFKPGQSGCPGGRAKGAPDVRALARGYTVAAITALGEIVMNPKATAPARVSAATVLLERGWGKPLQTVEVKRTPFDDMEPDELRAVEAALQALSDDEAGAAGRYPGTVGTA